jgi:hypothetical protein
MAECLNCGALFEAKRSTAKFCSDKCKLAYHRDKVSVTNDTLTSVTELSVSESQGNTKGPVKYPENWLRMTPNECSRWIRANKPELLEQSDILPANFGQPDCECMHCRAVKSNGLKVRLNHGPNKTASQLDLNELNRVALPGDPDYVGVAQI